VRLPILALFRIDPSVNRTPKSLTPRLGQVLELCPLWLQWEQRRVMARSEADPPKGKYEVVGAGLGDPNHGIRDMKWEF